MGRRSSSVLLLAVVALAGCGGGNREVLRPHGIDGIATGMRVREVARHWPGLHAREVVLGSDSDSFASICRGPLRGWLRFHGSNGGPFFLEEIHFLAGVRTDRGIGLGATRAEVRRAYGRSLLRRKRSTALMVLAGRRRGASERDATVFAFRGGRVDQIVFGLRSDLAESRRPDSFTPRCR